MEETLEALCEVLDAELDRQQRVRDIVAAQHQAIRARDAEQLEAQTADLRAVIEETLNAEQRRVALLEPLVNYFGLAAEDQTLSGLIAASPEPWKSRMRRFQQQMQEVMEESRSQVRENNQLLRFSLKWTNTFLGVVEQWFGSGPADYDARGGQPPWTQQRPAVIDQRG